MASELHHDRGARSDAIASLCADRSAMWGCPKLGPQTRGISGQTVAIAWHGLRSYWITRSRH